MPEINKSQIVFGKNRQAETKEKSAEQSLYCLLRTNAGHKAVFTYSAAYKVGADITALGNQKQKCNQERTVRKEFYLDYK